MRTHIFVVNQDTFTAHLQYMFAGTSSGKKDWNISLLADVKRARAGDKVIFYYEMIGFYGIFKIKENINRDDDKLVVYYDKDNYCEGALNRKLLYRVMIEPDEVFSDPVSEWDALEKLPGNPRDIIWSLIYRKMKAGRGCSTVTPKEAERLIDLIKKCNKGNSIINPVNLTWKNGKIIKGDGKNKKYNISNAEVVDIEEYIYSKRGTETYLQAYFTENAGISHLDYTTFSDICGRSYEIMWIGNEFYCGVGMQKIDIFTITNDEERKYRVIELKTKEDTRINNQLDRYIKWCREYISDTSMDNLLPIIVIPQSVSDSYKDMLKSTIIPEFNKSHREECKNVEWYEFYFNKERKICFNRVDYKN